jgi:Rrf2 family iron-sulfur cluster assembly transcriptional regulator
MNITSKTEYALRALQEVICSEEGKPVTRKQIARKQGLSEHFLEKIFIGLQKKEIIRSVRGPGGGFVLNRDPSQITLWDIYIAVDDPDYKEERCYHKSAANCEQEAHCQVKNIWFKFGKTMRESMGAITLVDIGSR